MTGLTHRKLKASPGCELAGLLKGAWRASAPAWQDDTAPLAERKLAEHKLSELTPLLLGSGAGGLGWARIRDTDLRATAAGAQLQQAYRLQTLRGALCERKLAEVFGKLRAVDIEPLLLKGWASARIYPEKGLRPCGDIDLYVRPDQQARAAAALVPLRRSYCWIQGRSVVL